MGGQQERWDEEGERDRMGERRDIGWGRERGRMEKGEDGGWGREIGWGMERGCQTCLGG